MTGGFQYDVDGIRSTAPEFSKAADGVTDAWKSISDLQTAEGACWGGDAAGQAFANSYLPAVIEAEQCAQAISTLLSEVRSELDGSATTMESSDQDSAATFDGGMR